MQGKITDIRFDKTTVSEAAKILFKEFNSGQYDAFNVAELVKSQMPMYTGNLNPKWKFWNDVVEEIRNEHLADLQDDKEH